MANNGALDTLPDSLRLASEPSTSLVPSRNQSQGNIVVFSGGSAANNLVDVFNEVREANQSTLSYIIPISDNGGSSSELIRVFGGPGEHVYGQSLDRACADRQAGIGDVRSRLVRLIPEDGLEASAIKHFFNYRLPRSYGPARAEWLDIIEATHSLWDGISTPKKELIRSILNVMNLEMLKKLRPSSRFDYSGASIGNLFLTGYDLPIVIQSTSLMSL